MKRIENSLRPPVVFSDSKRWNLEERMAYYDVPGVSVAVIAEHELVGVAAYGVVDKDSKEKVSAETIFQVGSLSKPVAAYGALLLAQEGKLNTTAPVNNYLRSWLIPENHYTRERAVSTEQILSHRSGLSVSGFGGYERTQPLPNLEQILSGSPPALNEPVFVENLPGSVAKYSGGGYTVLQQVLIDLDDKTFPNLMRDRVLDPLNMTSSTFQQQLSSHLRKTAAVGHLPGGAPVEGGWHLYPEMAAAGLWSNASDMAKFLIEILKTSSGIDTDHLSKEFVDQMINPGQVGTAGLGLFRRTTYIAKNRYFEHTGWNEGFCAMLVGDSITGNGVVILINANQPDFIDELLFGVAETFTWPEFSLPEQSVLKSDAEEISKIVGTYAYSEDNVIQIFEEEGHVYFQYTDSPQTELLKVGPNLYLRRGRENHITFIGSGDSRPVLRFKNVDGSSMDAQPVPSG